MSSARTRALPTARRPSSVVAAEGRGSRRAARRRRRACANGPLRTIASRTSRPREIGRDRAGLDQPRGDAQILEAVLRRDRPAPRRRPRATRLLQRAGGCRRGAARSVATRLQLDERLGEPLGRAGEDQAGADRPVDGEGAVAPGDGEIGERLAAERRAGPALPARPGAAAVDSARRPAGRCRSGRRRSRRPGRAGRGRCRAGSPPAPRRARAAAGRRRRGPARATVPGVERHLGAAVGDLDPAVERRADAAARSPPDRSAAGRSWSRPMSMSMSGSSGAFGIAGRAAAGSAAQPRLGDVERRGCRYRLRNR